MKLDLHHYLSFDGNCGEAMAFYQRALGGELHVMAFRGSPMEAQTDPAMLDKVMHARLKGDGFVIFGSDIPSDHYETPNPMMQLSANMWTAEDAEALFAELSEGAQIFMPLQPTFWAERFGMLRDRYGFGWTVNYEKKP